MVALPGVDRPVADRLDRGRRRHAAGRRGGRAGRLRLRGRPDLGRGLLHRRQRRDERRRQEGGAVGHRARQPGVVADGDARGQVARGDAPRPQPRQDPRRRGRQLRAALLRRRAARQLERTERLDIPGARVPQGRPRQGRHRQVPRRPAGHPEGRLRRPDHLGALDRAPHAGARAHRLPRVLRQRRRTRCRRSSRSRTTCSPSAKRAGGAILAGLEHLDDRYLQGGRLRHQDASAAACRRWC